MNKTDQIIIKGARLNNLKNISVKIPKNKIVVITGLSGSGKSTLAYDTIYAECERRYVESLSSYARQFLKKNQKPEFDEIKGLSPAISIKANTSITNSRSTVGTSTEIYHYLTLLYERVGKVFSPISGKEVKRNAFDIFQSYIYKFAVNTKFLICCPINFIQLQEFDKKGYSRIVVNDQIIEIKNLINSKKYHQTILLVIDRLIFNSNQELTKNLHIAYNNCMKIGGGICCICNKEGSLLKEFNNNMVLDNIQFEPPSRNLFNFNNPYGACYNCNGHGDLIDLDEDKIIPNKELSVSSNVVQPWRGESMEKWKNQFISKTKSINFPITKKYSELSKKEKHTLWNGNKEIKGINDFFSFLHKKSYKIQYRVMLSKYRSQSLCKLCQGSRLNPKSNYVLINKKSINELINVSISELLKFIKKIEPDKKETIIINTIINEIKSRIQLMINLGLDYLTLNRKSNSLSGGEVQRINIAKSIGSILIGAIYILDEPTIGLHAKDTKKLLDIIRQLKSSGNSIIIVEHDKDIIKGSDYMIEMGPLAGIDGGNVVYEGTVRNLKENSLTLDFINNKELIQKSSQKRISKEKIILTGITKNNLKNVDITIPLKVFTAITGVSGSGKTTLLKGVTFPAIKRKLKDFSFKKPVYNNLMINAGRIDHIEFIDQNSIKKSSKSTPITYIKAFNYIREIFAKQPLSRINNLTSKHFSFNITGGRCEHCKGLGYSIVEMQFLADIKLTCKYCSGKRYNDEVLKINFKNLTINDILNLTIKEAFSFFQKNRCDKVCKSIEPLIQVGLGYIKLGQPINTLSSGELQRLKLGCFLNEKQKNSILIFDEPTKGLHFHDIKILMAAFQKLIDQSNTIIVIEHNLDVIKNVDWVLDLGPGGGDKGGKIIFSGTPENLSKSNSYTGIALKSEFNER